MDPAYITWIAVAAVGAIVGLFLRPQTIVIASAVLFAAAALGIYLAYGSGDEKLGFMFGMATMVIPVLGGMLAVGAAVIRAILRKR
jgi:hypothetical protein